MSIFQEFEKVRNSMGHEKFDMIEKYLEEKGLQKNVDEYFKEMKNIWEYPTHVWNDKIRKLKRKYNVVFLDEVIYNEKEWQKYEIWYNEEHLHRNIKILSTWVSDFDDICCNAILSQNGKELANIITSYDETDIRYSIGDKDSEMTDNFVRKAFKSLIYDNFNRYLELPKISECSKLLQEIYDTVCQSEASMCHISDEDWNDLYADEFSEHDVDILREEIKKYGLDTVIVLEDGEYKITGFGNLEESFNDDRGLGVTSDKEIEM